MPVALLVVNTSGSFAIGLLGALVFERHRSAVGTRVFLAAGILGGWTTYSGIVSGFLYLGHEQQAGWAIATLATYTSAELAGQTLGAGDTIQMKADANSAITCAGINGYQIA